MVVELAQTFEGRHLLLEWIALEAAKALNITEKTLPKILAQPKRQ